MPKKPFPLLIGVLVILASRAVVALRRGDRASFMLLVIAASFLTRVQKRS